MSLRPTLGLCIGVLAASFAVTGCVSEWHVGDDGYDEEGLPPCDAIRPRRLRRRNTAIVPSVRI